MKHSPHFVDVYISLLETDDFHCFFKLLKWPSSAELWWHQPMGPEENFVVGFPFTQIPIARTARTMSKQKQSQCIFLRLEFLKPQNVVLWHERGHVRWTENTHPIPIVSFVVSPVFLHQNFWGTGHQQEIDDAERAARGYQWLGPAFQWKLWSSEVVHFHEKRMEELFPQWIRNPQTFQAPKVEVLTYVSCM